MPPTLLPVVRSFSFDWFDHANYRLSKANRIEIYLKSENNNRLALKNLFDNLFSKIQNELLIYDSSWWDFCLDTWSISNDTHNYDLADKSNQTQQYLQLLRDSDIPIEYQGLCKCSDWDYFLSVILPCITTNVAPYSPILLSERFEFLFYFHHTNSIGLYYKEKNPFMDELIELAKTQYEIID